LFYNLKTCAFDWSYRIWLLSSVSESAEWRKKSCQSPSQKSHSQDPYRKLETLFLAWTFLLGCTLRGTGPNPLSPFSCLYIRSENVLRNMIGWLIWANTAAAFYFVLGSERCKSDQKFLCRACKCASIWRIVIFLLRPRHLCKLRCLLTVYSKKILVQHLVLAKRSVFLGLLFHLVLVSTCRLFSLKIKCSN